MKKTSLRAKLIRVFALQMLLISLATLLGIFLTNSIVQDVLMRGALNGEAEHYWALYKDNPNQPLPNTDNMVGHLVYKDDYSQVPESVVQIGNGPGYHRGKFKGDEQIVHVSERITDNGPAHLFLVFDNESVSDLAFFFGIVPLSIVLLLVYALMLFAYRMSQRAISPIVRLANYLEDFQFGKGHHPELDLGPLRDQADSEVAAMTEALDHFTQRVDSFVERERVFTRDASHELRTPVAVFKASLDLLAKDPARPAADALALARMRRTVNDMEGLIETLLLLANEQMPPNETVRVNDVARRQIDLMQPMAQSAGNSLELEELAQLDVEAPQRVVQIIITNLIRNAVTYTQSGTVTLSISATSMRVHDTGMGMTEEELSTAFDPFVRGERARDHSAGHGLGLSIVKRLVTQFDWRIQAQSAPDAGTSIELAFT